MRKKGSTIVLLTFAYLMTIPLGVWAATITMCAFDRTTYNQGETGYLTITIYNDRDDKIRVTELTATIDYYYTDGTVYIQTFYTNTTLPVEIGQGQSETFIILFSLPTNIASGYTNPLVKAKTELWNSHAETWFGSEHPTYRLVLYIESPYKQQFEAQQAINQQLQQQLESLQQQVQELQTAHNTSTSMMYLFGFTTFILALMAVFLVMISRKAKTTPMA